MVVNCQQFVAHRGDEAVGHMCVAENVKQQLSIQPCSKTCWKQQRETWVMIM